MPIDNYGVWKATPTSFRAQRHFDDPRSPHGYLQFKDDLSRMRLEAAINVKSISADSRLVYWLVQDLDHPLTNQLKALGFGWHSIGKDETGLPGGLALDYLRSGIVEVTNGRLLPHDVPGDQNDIVDLLEPFFKTAIEKKATVYLYGEQFDGKDGVHDVHMNQGNTGRFKSQNGILQDGGVLVEFDDGHWEALLLAFASQASKTDNEGNANGPRFAELLEIQTLSNERSGAVARPRI
jgi:uncharacterized protein YukJ